MNTRSTETTELLVSPGMTTTNTLINGKVLTISVISIVNGTLYFSIAVAGGGNIKSLFDVNGDIANVIVMIAGAGASLVYTMFTYKTLEALSLKINSISKGILASLAPFSALAFLTAGKDGAKLLQFNNQIALGIGVSVFGLRMINCIDASVKFPDRLLETKQAWSDAMQIKDYWELARLSVVWLASIGYVACTTDAIYNATSIIFNWLSYDNNVVIANVSLAASILGALGTLPLNVYWSHRGLRQLTFGGKSNVNGENPDPTDRYTYIGLALVTPVMLGILGGATASTGAVFGRLGTFSQVVRVSTSIMYAAFAGTPGMATLLRNTTKYIKSSQATDDIENVKINELDKDVEQNTKASSRCFSFFSKNRSKSVEEEKSIKRCSCTIL